MMVTIGVNRCQAVTTRIFKEPLVILGKNACKIEMPSSDRPRINLSPDSDLQRDLEDWAEQQKRPVASMALYLLSRSVEEAKKTGEFIPASEKAARNRTQINILDLQKLADQLEIPSDRLLKAIKEIKLEVINGGH
jgi:CopG-like RHH_1 or ribbon-helix-helix domain, RHH_5